MENPNLTNSDPYVRAKAVDALVEAMDNLNAQRCAIFSTFLIARLSDQLSVAAAINGLLKLLNSGNLSEIDKIWIAILEELNVSSFPQNVRFQILEIYDKITQQSTDLTRDFVAGFLHIVQGMLHPLIL